MSEHKHTPGPWRWEVNLSSKVVQLCGGKPQYDLTVMDFERWGMGGAIPRFCDASDRGLLTRCLKWACKVIGREHHARWFQSLDHPDARLIAAAPEMLEALIKAQDELNDLKSFYGKNLQVYGWHLNGEPEAFDNFITDNDCGATEAIAIAIAKAKGKEVA